MPLDLETRAARAALPFALLQEASVPCSYERSVKSSPGRLLTNRYLLSFLPASSSHQWLVDACRRLRMPDARLEEFLPQLPEANLLFFGFEEDGQECTYKAYAEFYDRRRAELAAGKHAAEPQLIHIGYKWSPDSKDAGRVTRYWWHPELDAAAIERRISNFASNHVTTSCSFATEVLRLARARADEHLYMEVEDEDNPRRSFNLRVYNADVRVRDVGDAWRRAAEAYELDPADVSRTLDLIGDRTLGNVSGGITKDGRDFVTIYFDCTPTS